MNCIIDICVRFDLIVLLAGLVWRALASSGSGNTLVHAMSGSDEQNRALGRMALVKAGKRSVGLIGLKEF